MDISNILDPGTRQAWRAWLEANHTRCVEIWLLLRRERPSRLTYLEAVEEALCFGWIDGLAKKHGNATAQRFTPRRPRSHWTELNKERARRLIAAGKMTEVGLQKLPDLSEREVQVPDDVRQRLEAEPGAWLFFQGCPPLYQRVRLGYIEDVRKRDPKEFEKRLSHFVLKSGKRQLFGNWDDKGLPRSDE
ncbi:MAG: YdeI/OmpD-associated family protein [Myxococcales bacterium]|nr:YdeI/OmpD-associated family protein [Myxococcales bacterium]